MLNSPPLNNIAASKLATTKSFALLDGVKPEAGEVDYARNLPSHIARQLH
jgi:hypothetical protein